MQTAARKGKGKRKENKAGMPFNENILSSAGFSMP